MRVRGAVLFAGLAACRIGEADHETVVYAARAATETRACSTPFVAPDLATLAPCGGARGHCWPTDKTPIASLAPCDGDGHEVCVPDKLLAANGTRLKACTFFLGNKPGACTSTLVPDVGAHADQLKQDVCDADERCAPCVNPIDGTDTHLCEPTGVHAGACTSGAGERQASCCHGSGACIDPEAAPPDQRGDLQRDICPADKVCAPAALVDGNPTRCHAFGDKGVCVDVCFAAQLAPAAPVIRSVCGPTEVCIPCVVGAGKGMPGC